MICFPMRGFFSAVKVLMACVSIFLVCGLVNPVAAGWPEIIFPDDPGITLSWGCSYDIRWRSVPGTYVNVALYTLEIDEEGDEYADWHSDIAIRLSNTGSFRWTVPHHLPQASNYLIRVENNSGSMAGAFSDHPFTIGNPPVVSPAAIKSEQPLEVVAGSSTEHTYLLFYNFATLQSWSADRYGSYSVNYPLPYGQWLGAYLYNYHSGQWQDGFNVFKMGSGGASNPAETGFQIYDSIAQENVCGFLLTRSEFSLGQSILIQGEPASHSYFFFWHFSRGMGPHTDDYGSFSVNYSMPMPGEWMGGYLYSYELGSWTDSVYLFYAF